MIIDLHVHTVHGSGDSNLSPEQLVEEAARIGLDGACLTEHNRTWDARDLQEFVRDHNHVLLMRAMEVETNMGHITVFGLDGYVPGIWNLEELRRVADKEGAFIVTAHPFRGLFNPSLTNLLFKEDAHPPATVEEAARHPVFGLVDAIEVANGGQPGGGERLCARGGPLPGEARRGRERLPFHQWPGGVRDRVSPAHRVGAEVHGGAPCGRLLSGHGAPHGTCSALRRCPVTIEGYADDPP